MTDERASQGVTAIKEFSQASLDAFEAIQKILDLQHQEIMCLKDRVAELEHQVYKRER
jgi:hypothetical protein